MADNDLVTVPRYALYDYKNPFQYGWFTINFFLAIHIFAQMIEMALPKIKFQNLGHTYSNLTREKQKNTVTYVMQGLLTAVGFVFLFEGSYRILFLFEDETNHEELEFVVMALHIAAALYLWELVYRDQIGLPLLVHHVMTLVFFQAMFATFYPDNLTFQRIGMAMGFYAVTEHLSFVALFCFRLNILRSWHEQLFYYAAVQAFVVKTIITAFIIPYFILAAYVYHDLDSVSSFLRWFWYILFIPLAIVMYWSQVYGAKILYSLSLRCRKRREEGDDEESGDSKEGDEEMASKTMEMTTADQMSSNYASTIPQGDVVGTGACTDTGKSGSSSSSSDGGKDDSTGEDDGHDRDDA